MKFSWALFLPADSLKENIIAYPCFRVTINIISYQNNLPLVDLNADWVKLFKAQTIKYIIKHSALKLLST